ncbi:hypothetical protein B484DRAFT_457240 [Ochromonadaceae sp. CCMP2298]|nr:hypothetical protein B484DRAFT_457240 [Ochromonadaceae sp. CCMP2298]
MVARVGREAASCSSAGATMPAQNSSVPTGQPTMRSRPSGETVTPRSATPWSSGRSARRRPVAWHLGSTRLSS